MPDYESVRFSRSKIEKAGKVISQNKENPDQYKEYIEVVDNWRASHAYPLDRITTIVTESLEGRDSYFVVQRLKRLESIVGKLQRPNNTGLYRMQDLGGCRVIVPKYEELYDSIEQIQKAIISRGHEIVKIDDYIKSPRIASGYRSYHMVVKYHEDNSSFDGMFVEVQVRTKIEHAWATAVEIVDIIKKDSLKAGYGNPVYTRFFKLVSGLFSISEGTAVVEGISLDKANIVYEIYDIDNKESIRPLIAAYNSAIRVSGSYPKEASYYILESDYRKSLITTTPFSKEHIVEATQYYQQLEREKHSNMDVVLVSASSFEIIRECYPNYFGDTLFFLQKIGELCTEFPEKVSLNIATNKNGVRVKDLFNASYFNKDVSLHPNFEDGIGKEFGDIYYCPNWSMRLENSYLRYSGIISNNELFDYVKAGTNQVTGTSILVNSTGASFYVDKQRWSYYCNMPSMVLSCKPGTSPDAILVLLAWIKSDVFAWDLVWNKHKTSPFYVEVFHNMYIPRLKDSDLDRICVITKEILKKEKDFVAEYNKMDSSDLQTISKMIDSFNQNILHHIRENESIFDSFYNLDDSHQRMIKQDLNLKGYYSYYEG